MSSPAMQPLHRRLLECFTAEATTINPLDDTTTTTTSLHTILTTLSTTPTTLHQLDDPTAPASPATAQLAAQLAALPPCVYQRLVGVLCEVGDAGEAVAAGAWEALTAEGVACRPLVAVVGVLLQRLSVRSLLLATCYVQLLALPSPPVFLANQRVLRRILVQLQSWAQKRQEITIQHKSGRRAKGSKAKKGNSVHMQVDDDEDAEEEEGGGEDEEQTEQEEMAELLGEAGERLVVQLLRAMQRLLSHWSLLPMADIKPALIDALVAVTRTQQDEADGDSPASLAWQLLGSLCQPLHGDTAATFALLLRPLLPNCLMSFVLHTTPTPPRPLQLIHAATMRFLTAAAPAPTHLLPLLQHALVATPDRAEYRRVVQHSLVALLGGARHAALLAAFAPFLRRVSRNAKAALRQSAVDVAALLLLSAGGGGGDGGEGVGMLGGLLELLLLRCSDRSPVVRTRALGALGDLLQLAGERADVRDALVAVLEEGEHNDDDDEAEAEAEHSRGAGRRASLFLATPHRHGSLSLSAMDLYTPVTSASLHQPWATPSAVPPSLGVQSLLRLLHRRSADRRALVRRAALLALHRLLLLHGAAPRLLPSLSAHDLQALYDGCMDESVAVRRAACGALTALWGAFPADEVLGAVWCGGVLPLVDDAEAGVAERAVQCVGEAVLARLQAGGEVERASVLRMLGGMDEASVRYFGQAIARLAKQDGLPRSLVSQLNASIADSQERGVWLLVEAVCQHHAEAIDVKRLCATWNNWSDSQAISDELHVCLLSCIGHLAHRLPLQQKLDMATQLSSRVCDLDTPLSPQLTKGHIHTLSTLATATQKHHPTAALNDAPHWDSELLAVSAHRLEQLVLGGAAAWGGRGEAVVVRCLYGVGELVVRGVATAAKPPPSTVACMQSLSVATLGAPPVALSAAVRAHAVSALGKLCLRDAALAKRCLPLLLGVLSGGVQGAPAAVRNNALLVLGDLCRAHTALVDPHLGALLGCLGDGCALLRRHALLVVCQLVQEDYVKPRAAVLMPLLQALADDDDGVAAVARSSLAHLVQRHGGKLQHSLLDAIHFLNGHTTPPPSASSTSSPPASHALSSYSRRSVVYDFLCGQMSDESKLMTASKLCQDVLAAVVDGSLPLNERTSPIVHDTLGILASDNMKLHHPTNKTNDDDLPDDDDDTHLTQQQQPAAQQHVAESLKAAKSRLLSRLSKRGILEQVLPVLMELKRRLEAARSPLVRGVLEWMRCLHVEWRADVTAVLAADRQLAVEMEYDMRRMEDERKDKTRRHSEQRRLDSAQSGGRRRQAAAVAARAEAAPAPVQRLSLSNVAASLPAPSPVRAPRASLSSASPASATPSPAAPPSGGRSSLPGSGAAPVVPALGAFATPAKGGGRLGGVAATPSSAVFQSPRLLRGHGTPQASATAAATAAKRLSLRAAAAPVPLFDAAPPAARRASASPLADKENAAAGLTVNLSAAAVDGGGGAAWQLGMLALSSAKKARPPQAREAAQEGLQGGEQLGEAAGQQQQRMDGGVSLRKRRISASAEQQVKQEKEVENVKAEQTAATAQLVKRTRSGRGRNSTGHA